MSVQINELDTVSPIECRLPKLYSCLMYFVLIRVETLYQSGGIHYKEKRIQGKKKTSFTCHGFNVLICINL